MNENKIFLLSHWFKYAGSRLSANGHFYRLQSLKSTGVETGRIKVDKTVKKIFFLKKDKTLTLPSPFLDELGINAHASLFTVSRFYTRRIKRLSRESHQLSASERST